MTKEQFSTNYYCKLDLLQNDFTIKIISKVVRRSDGFIVDKISSDYDIYETNNWIVDSNTPISLLQWDWSKILDQTKRFHLDYFVQRAPIENFFPLDTEKNPSIEGFYIQ